MKYCIRILLKVSSGTLRFIVTYIWYVQNRFFTNTLPYFLQILEFLSILWKKEVKGFHLIY